MPTFMGAYKYCVTPLNWSATSTPHMYVVYSKCTGNVGTNTFSFPFLRGTVILFPSLGKGGGGVEILRTKFFYPSMKRLSHVGIVLAPKESAGWIF